MPVFIEMGVKLIDLEAVKARHSAAGMQRAATVMAGLTLTAASVSADDVEFLVAEIEDLRRAVAVRTMDGETLSMREAIRSELIIIGAEASATVDAIRALHTPVQDGRIFCAYVGEDRPDCSACYREDGGLAVGHPRTMCGHCESPRSFSFADEPAWPCATAKMLEPTPGADK